MRKALQIQEHNADTALKNAADAGFKYVSLGFGTSQIFYQDDWERRIEELKALLFQNGLTCIQTHLPCYNLLVSSETIDDAMEKAIHRCLKATSMLGAKWGAMHLRSSITCDYSRIRAKHDNCVCLESYLKTAVENNVGIALENLPFFPTQHFWRFYSMHYEDICELADEFSTHPDDEHIGICWDFGHANLARLKQCEALKYIGKRLKITHMHDNFNCDDEHLVPMLGHINWKEIMPVIEKIGYTGPLTLEIDYKINPATQSYFAFAFESLKHLESMMGKTNS